MGIVVTEASVPAASTMTTTIGQAPCIDKKPECRAWANAGECKTNAAYMLKNCRLSCGACEEALATGAADSARENTETRSLHESTATVSEQPTSEVGSADG